MWRHLRDRQTGRHVGLDWDWRRGSAPRHSRPRAQEERQQTFDGAWLSSLMTRAAADAPPPLDIRNDTPAYFFLAFSMPTRMRRFASSESPQPSTFTHFVVSRSL